MRARLGLIALVTAISLTACGGGDSTDAAVDTNVEGTETAAPSVTADFGAPLDLGNGVSVTISAPEAFTPGDFASNYIPGQVTDLFTIEVQNDGTAALDMSTVVFTATSGGNFCADVLDGDNGITGAPAEPVAAGASVSFKYAIGCDAKAGDPLELTVAIGETTAGLTGKLA